MLEFVSTSLLDSPAQTLVNPVNTVGVMGKGLAAEFKRRYPAMFLEYRRRCAAKQLSVGELHLYKAVDKWVLNFPTKEHWRQPSQLAWVLRGLECFVATFAAEGISSVAFPMLGCGAGGLDWRVVEPVMRRYLAPLPIPVRVHVVAAPDARGRPRRHQPPTA